jgi:hypothetical protein
VPIQEVPFPFFEKYEINPKNQNARKRSLRFDLNALADFEQEVGMGFAQLMQTKAAFATVRAMVWAGLKHEDRGLTVDRAGTLIGEYVRDGGSIDEILTLCIETAVDQGALGRPRVPETKPTDPAVPPAITDGTPT